MHTLSNREYIVIMTSNNDNKDGIFHFLLDINMLENNGREEISERSVMKLLR